MTESEKNGKQKPRKPGKTLDSSRLVQLVSNISQVFALAVTVLALVFSMWVFIQPQRVVPLLEQMLDKLSTPEATPTIEVVPTTKASATSLAVSTPYPPQPTYTPYPPNPTYTLFPTHTPYPPNPTYTSYPPRPTYTPYPTFTPHLVVATRAPVIVTPTPSAEEQNPPPGSTIPAGEAYTKGDITIRLLKRIEYGADALHFTFEIENGTKEQYLIRWKNSAIHLRDDVGKQYSQYGEEEKIYDKVKAFTLDPGKSIQLGSTTSGHWSGGYSDVDRFGAFKGPLSYDAKYLLITIDEIAGMSNLNWRYDLL